VTSGEGELPRGWAWSTVGEISTEVRSGFASGEHNASGHGIPHVRPMNVSRNGRIDLEDVKYVAREVDDRRLQFGDVVFNNTNSPALVGKTALMTINGEFAFSNHMTRVRTALGIGPGFVAHQLQYLWTSGRLAPFINNHVNQASIASKVLATQVFLAVAPSHEQERIVVAIAEHLSRLDTAEASAISARLRMNPLERSILQRADDCRWPEMELGELLLDIEAGKSFQTPGRRAAPEEWGVIKVSSMTWGAFDEQENKAVLDVDRVQPRFEIRPGDLLFSRANTSELVGASVLVHRTRPKLLLSDKSMRLLPQGEVDPEWLRYCLGSASVRDQISEVASGTSNSMRNISQDKVRRLRVHLPRKGSNAGSPRKSLRSGRLASVWAKHSGRQADRPRPCADPSSRRRSQGGWWHRTLRTSRRRCCCHGSPRRGPWPAPIEERVPSRRPKCRRARREW